MNNPLSIGTIVLSVSGRDKGNYFIVSGLPEENYVYLVDGRSRKLEKAKKKKIKHIKATGGFAAEVAAKLTENKYIMDSDIVKALKTFNGERK